LGQHGASVGPDLDRHSERHEYDAAAHADHRLHRLAPAPGHASAVHRGDLSGPVGGRPSADRCDRRQSGEIGGRLRLRSRDRERAEVSRDERGHGDHSGQREHQQGGRAELGARLCPQGRTRSGAQGNGRVYIRAAAISVARARSRRGTQA
jgi:hypothetical protein